MNLSRKLVFAVFLLPAVTSSVIGKDTALAQLKAEQQTQEILAAPKAYTDPGFPMNQFLRVAACNSLDNISLPMTPNSARLLGLVKQCIDGVGKNLQTEIIVAIKDGKIYITAPEGKAYDALEVSLSMQENRLMKMPVILQMSGK